MKTLQDSLNSYFGFRSARSSALDEEQRLDRNALAKARRLVAKHGMDLERDDDGYWVTWNQFGEDNDPLEGNHFCVGGREVLQAVETYLEAL